jgi:Mrp family chromosome partitioning ATPase
MKKVPGGRVLALPAAFPERGAAGTRPQRIPRERKNAAQFDSPANLDQRYRSLLVTSAAPAEGKTTTAANLAAAHAEQGRRTLLIDGDLRRPSVHRSFNLPGVIGLSNVLRGDFCWRAAVIPVGRHAQLARTSGRGAIAACGGC